MSISDRQKQIIDILENTNFITVNKLSEVTFTSPSSIRRDLTYLQNQGLVHRTHGGVTLSDSGDRVPTLYQRMSKNVLEKKALAKKASSLLKDGQSVMLDGSSTASFLLHFIARHEGITLFTNNMFTAIKAIELGISTHCTGGHSVKGSAVLSGEEAYKAVTSLHVDILFFSSQCIDKNGIISDSTQEENYLRRLMIESAQEKVFLCDNDKINRRSLYKLASLDEIDTAVFNREWPELKTKCNNILYANQS